MPSIHEMLDLGEARTRRQCHTLMEQGLLATHLAEKNYMSAYFSDIMWAITTHLEWLLALLTHEVHLATPRQLDGGRGAVK